ncbi:MAG: CmcI family methyltransferase [Gemmatimonadota bacterium]
MLIERVKKSREENGDLLQRYHDLWYSSGHTWHYTHFLGVGMMKCPNDIWMYQDLMSRLRPQVVVETGTYQGGSALWFAFLMDMLRINGGRVLTVDIKDYRKTWFVQHPRITYFNGNSADPEMAEAVESQLPEQGGRLVVLDSDHSERHVRDELELYAPMLRVGDWLVVEDTNIGWGVEHKVTLPDSITGGYRCSCGQIFLSNAVSIDQVKCPKDDNTGDRGARGGVQDYMDEHPGEFVQDLLSERYLLTMNPGGWMQRVKECEHV